MNGLLNAPMNTASIERALHRAREAHARGPHSAPEKQVSRRIHVAIGDPQADITKVLAILAHNGLLGDDGWLRPEVHLVSVGDHFDWGTFEERRRATESATLLLAWLAAHPADQVTLLLGNHDLARVGELALFDQTRFEAAQEEADRIYRSEGPRQEEEERFLASYPDVPSVEVLARDFSAFSLEQREWVRHLLRSRRFRIAFGHGELLVSHAGVTVDELRGLVEDVGTVPPGSAYVAESGRTPAEARVGRIAERLNAALDAAVDGWDGTPLMIRGLHRPGSAALGEGVGIFYHRASTLPQDDWSRGVSPPRRRYDPRRLPRGFTQVIGHVRDAKSRTLLDLNPREAWDGFLRHLWTDGYEVHYGHGTGERPGETEAAMIFTDGGMRTCPIAEYELLDLDRRAPFRAVRAEG